MPEKVQPKEYVNINIPLPEGCSYPDKLVIFHTNDHHGSFYEQVTGPGVKEGGLARQMTFIESQKEIHRQESRCPAFLTLRAGDVMSGDVAVDILQNEPDYSSMNIIGFNATVIGNHDVDYGIGVLNRLIKNVIEFPVLSANAFVPSKKPTDAGYHPYASYAIITMGGMKMALVGLTSDQTGPNDLLEEDKGKIDFEKPTKTMDRLIPQIRTEHDDVDSIAVLGHLGHKSDSFTHSSDVALGSAGDIDFIIDAHDHKLSKEPMIIQKDGETYPTVIVESGSKGMYVGTLVYTVRDGARLNQPLANGTPSYDYRVTKMTSDIEKHPEIVALEGKYKSDPRVKRLFDVVIEDNERLFEGSRSVTSKQTTRLTRFFTDAYRFCGAADISAIHPNGIRSTIYPKQDITVRDVINLSPFTFYKNRMVSLELTGAEVKRLLKVQRETGKTIHYSGITLQYKDGQPIPASDVGYDIGQAQIFINGEQLDMAKKYRMAGRLYFFKFVIGDIYADKMKPVYDTTREAYDNDDRYMTYNCLLDYFQVLGRERLNNKY